MAVILDLVILGVVLALLAALVARRRKRRRERAQWQVAIRSAPHATIVELVRPGEHSQRIARLDPASDDFSTQLEEARYAAMERAVALNMARQGLNPGPPGYT
jgi:LPXTG-motif cell wall-anchored protein